MRIITSELADFLRDTFMLEWRGVHGSPHWARVRANGLLLAERNGANTKVVELFAFLHDVRREHDGTDFEHGRRSGELARELNGRFFLLSSEEVELLAWACRDHSAGHLDGDITVQTCWDADRLDLGRVGIRPDPDQLCTPAARDHIATAYERSRRGR